jgi:hypothetical protein
MVFYKPFNEDERAFIRRNWGFMTHGDIARSLNELYKPYNGAERTTKGVECYIAEMNGGKVEVEIPRAIRDQLKDNGHDPKHVEQAIEKSVTSAINKIIEKPQRRAKAT